MRTPRIRTRSKLAAAMGAVIIVGSFSVASALAVHDANLFELDVTGTPPNAQGNANVADQAAAGDDWENVYKKVTGNGSASASTSFDETFKTDNVGSAENDFFTGGGSKDVNDIPQWQYGTTNDVVPDKDDLEHAFAAAYINPADDHTHVYFGVDRFDNNGDAETGFWFFQQTVELDGSGHFTGQH